MQDKIQEYRSSLKNRSAEEILSFFIDEFRGKIAFASSLGAEDQVLTDMISKIADGKEMIRIFTLDTGRLFNETYETLQYTKARYNMDIRVYFPDNEKVEQMVNEKGINLFYESVENRKLCCGIRKVESLKRALKGLDAWVTGLRSGQSQTRTGLDFVEWDEKFGIVKINPLAEWSEEQVWEYIKKFRVPYNTLHDKGYPSIGCEPCTRALTEGENLRDGRWWWENADSKECGLHVK